MQASDVWKFKIPKKKRKNWKNKKIRIFNLIFLLKFKIEKK